MGFFFWFLLILLSNPTSAASFPSIYYLNSTLPSAWSNNNSINMNLTTTDGSQVRAILVSQSPLVYAFGFYSITTNSPSYLFSVVLTNGVKPSVVWTPKGDLTVGENAVISLTREGNLVLKESDGSDVWATNTTGRSVAGMNMTEYGNLVLFDRKGNAIWESFGNSTVALLTGKRKQNNLPAIIAGLVSATFVLVVSLIAAFVVKHRKAKADEERRKCITQVPGMPVKFSFKELQTATSNFRERLGGGGGGTVYKGMMQDGTLIAVKRLYKRRQSMKEFLAEVETIGSIHHFNLVRLIGFCAGKPSCLLVYEFMPNGSLENWIYGPGSDQRPVLDWEKRKKIVLDIAKGLAYLHEECRQRIIHLDIKPQNILLDEQFNAKISDFGLSKLVDRGDSQVLTTMRGTPGYIAPECGNSNITVKVDIYSFGIVLLEIVSGRRNWDATKSESSKHLLYLLQKKAAEDEVLDIVENLEEEDEEVRVEMERMIRIAAWCLQNDPMTRPLMSTVMKVLEGVMEVNPDIKFRFVHAMTSPAAATPAVSAAPQASVLSNPR